MNIFIKYLLYYALLLISFTQYYKIIDNFTINKKSYFYIFIATEGLFILFKYSIWNKMGLTNLLILKYILFFMLILTVTDWKYYEIHGKSYLFIILPVIIYVIANKYYQIAIINLISCFILLLVLEKISYLLIKNKHKNVNEDDYGLGGADLKLLLILSLIIPSFSVLKFIFLTFLSAIGVYLIKSFVNQDFSDQRIPLITNITIATILIFI